jgi:23S rRNA (uridine2552-2'-O)-methyltransferase
MKSNAHRKDPHYKRAKLEGYRARSAYKLLEIGKRFDLFKRAFYILDLGCAPGSWLQVSKKFAEKNLNIYKDQFYNRDHYKIMGVDLKKVFPIENIKIIKSDITKPEFQKYLAEFFQSKLDLILSDASVNKIGNKFTDHIKQINLCYKVFDISIKFLKFKGNLVIKAFQGSDLNKLLKVMKKEFKFLKSYKPKSSQKKSNEIYIIGLKKI